MIDLWYFIDLDNYYVKDSTLMRDKIKLQCINGDKCSFIELIHWELGLSFAFNMICESWRLYLSLKFCSIISPSIIL